ncbi:hypothetical protein TSUD_337400 [Trifolium subterraneum]|uniref:VOC domain-containing protein n=1 Tax=Trifolium subterraneum TaxID=3900 RepID=A0A2Z6MSE8_TRISU|nr:hypothetical protein TSUD_337400 [Trifolium subterraneum]
MAESDWPKKDNRRFLHVVYRVGDLEQAIKFYTKSLGFKLLRQRDVPAENTPMLLLDLAMKHPILLLN